MSEYGDSLQQLNHHHYDLGPDLDVASTFKVPSNDPSSLDAVQEDANKLPEGMICGRKNRAVGSAVGSIEEVILAMIHNLRKRYSFPNKTVFRS